MAIKSRTYKKHKHTKNCKICNQKGGECGCGNFFSGGRTRARSGKRTRTGKRTRKFYGGMTPAVVPPLVGKPWTSNINDWPGVSGKTGETNYFNTNKYIVSPTTQTIQGRDSIYNNGGGRRRRRGTTRRSSRNRRVRKGGSFIPQDLVNSGRMLLYKAQSAYNITRGYPEPVNPLPYKDQLIRNV